MFSDSKCINLDKNVSGLSKPDPLQLSHKFPQSSPFFILLHALSIYTKRSKLSPNLLPLSPTLPDLKSDTKSYIHLQLMYKDQASYEKAEYKSILQEVVERIGAQDISEPLVDEFVKNCHQLKLMRGKLWGENDEESLCKYSALVPVPIESLNHQSKYNQF